MRRACQAVAVLAFVAVAAVSCMAAGKPLERYATLVVGNFRVDPELKKAGFPAGYEDVLQKSLFARLLSERVFPQVVDGSVGAFARDSPATPLIAEGEVADFSKGNRAARVAIGYGAGSAKIKIVMRFRDMATGLEVLRLEQVGRYAGFGNLTGGSAAKAQSESARKVVDGLVKKIKAAR